MLEKPEIETAISDLAVTVENLATEVEILNENAERRQAGSGPYLAIVAIWAAFTTVAVGTAYLYRDGNPLTDIVIVLAIVAGVSTAVIMNRR